MFGVSLEKKGSGAMGGTWTFGPPQVGGPAPTYPLQEQKWQKSATLTFYIFAPSPPPHNPLPPPQQKI